MSRASESSQLSILVRLLTLTDTWRKGVSLNKLVIIYCSKLSQDKYIVIYVH